MIEIGAFMIALALVCASLRPVEAQMSYRRETKSAQVASALPHMPFPRPDRDLTDLAAEADRALARHAATKNPTPS